MTACPEEVATGFAAAWDAADAGLLSELFTEDADFVNVVGLWWRTRAQIRDNHAYGFRHMFPHTVMALKEVIARQLGPDVAVVHAAWTLTPTLTFARNTARVELVALWRRFLVAPCRNSARKASTYSQYIAAAREQRRIS